MMAARLKTKDKEYAAHGSKLQDHRDGVVRLREAVEKYRQKAREEIASVGES